MPEVSARDIRDFDPERRQAIFVAMWTAMAESQAAPDGSAFIPSKEVLDALAMIAGIVLAHSPLAKIPSQMRGWISEHGESIINYADAYLNGPENPLIIAMPGLGEFQ